MNSTGAENPTPLTPYAKPKRRRTHHLNIPLTLEELSTIRLAAHSFGMETATWCRWAMFKLAADETKDINPERAEALYQHAKRVKKEKYRYDDP